MEQGTVSTNSKDGIATITFFHPQSNSLSGDLLRMLADEITSAGENPDTKVIILKSEGDKAFCAGASFDELISIKNFEEGKKFFSGFALVINAIRKVPQFVIARVQGKAVGGGVGLASVADYTLAFDNASVKLSELALGIGPFVVGPAVERKIGKSAFVSLTINASEWHSAEWAKQNGLYAQTFSSVEEMDKAIDALTTKLSAGNPDAMHELKKNFWEGTDHWDELLIQRAEISGRLVLSEYTRKAIEKFKSKKN
ncbi:MAG TPA: enoyl-CoA hydratase/isomerase family protein [Bacteroidia bacterium]|nr:enoyl-CoA hydratase/isomerase family protein [Bacteroidia bacterium]